ncbi:hypothetical protein DV736_g6307, partial [Chaetothyriales sp. CBS 134916]
MLAALPAVLKIAQWVYDHGFRSMVEGAPDNQYATFGREVKGFATNLEKLQNALQRASNSRSNGPPTSEHDLDLEPFQGLVGDYRATLKACRKLLENNTHFERNADGIIRKILWTTMLADDVAELRNRINFHNVRLVAVLKPLELTLYLKLEEDIQRLHRDVLTGFSDVKTRLAVIEGVMLGNVFEATVAAKHTSPNPLPVVPAFLRGRFAAASHMVQKVYITDQIRLSSAIGHFANGTYKFRPGIDPGPEPSNFVSLWKSVWLLQQLKDSPGYSHFLAAELNASIINEYERLILEETNRFDIRTDDLLQDIEKLPSSEFTMWIFEPTTPRKNLPEPNPEEVKAFECSLVDESSTESLGLVVLTSLARLNILRVVETITSNIGDKPDREREQFIDVTKVKLFPTYTRPKATVFNLQMRSSPAATMDKTFSFTSLESLHFFQQCLTGFYVELDLPGLTKVSYKQSGVFSGCARAQVIGNYGRAQIWTHELSKDEAGDIATPNGNAEQSSRGRQQPPSTVSSQSASRTLVDWTSIHTPSVIWRGQHAELPCPERPLVVLPLATIDEDLTHSVDTRYRLLAIRLDGSVIIDESRCDCRNHDDTCTRVVISSRSRFCAKLFEYGNDVYAMNIAALRRPQKHDEYKKDVKRLNNVGRVSVDFRSIQDKRDFRERLRAVVDNHIGLWQKYKTQIAMIRGADFVARSP